MYLGNFFIVRFKLIFRKNIFIFCFLKMGWYFLSDNFLRILVSLFLGGKDGKKYILEFGKTY